MLSGKGISILCLVIIPFIFISCLPTSNSEKGSTPTIAANRTLNPDETKATSTPISAAVEFQDFRVKIGDSVCALREIPIDENFYIDDCESELLFPINRAVTIELIPPDKNEYMLLELFDELELVEILFHDALIAYFRDGPILNQTDFVIPFSTESGVDVILGFSIELDQEITVLIKGTAIR